MTLPHPFPSPGMKTPSPARRPAGAGSRKHCLRQSMPWEQRAPRRGPANLRSLLRGPCLMAVCPWGSHILLRASKETPVGHTSSFPENPRRGGGMPPKGRSPRREESGISHLLLPCPSLRSYYREGGLGRCRAQGSRQGGL